MVSVISRWSVVPASVALLCSASALQAVPNEAETVSYYEQIRPLFQAYCHGCHQPAKPRGKYVMTSFAEMLSGGESETPAVVAGKPDESPLLEMITPEDGEAEMPKGKDPLTERQIELIRRWIAQGADDDTPESAKVRYDADHPPTYTAPPVITSLDFSPDGKLLAVAGFHEVLLHEADGSRLVARLVGMSARIESVRFSPDGRHLAVTGGLPARMGEVQVWDVAKRILRLSVPVTYDTVYGASWSPDGKLIAFGCSDNTVRVINARTGKEVLYQGAHNGWVLDTVFSKEGTHLISVGRDRTAKLTELSTQRFMDNITSITPGVLKGGIASVVRHPTEDVILVGGADGVPRLYRIFRQSKRVIGDDANLIRTFPALPGRIFDVAISRDGRRVAAGSSLDGTGQVRVYSHEVEGELPEALAPIVKKRASARSKEEKRLLAEHRNKGVKLIAEISVDAGVYAVAFRPDGHVVAAAGSDGKVRLLDAETGSQVRTFVPVPVTAVADGEIAGASEPRRISAGVIDASTSDVPRESLHADDKLVSIVVQPDRVRIDHKYDVAQFLVTGRLESGATVDVTRMVDIATSGETVDVSPNGLVRARADGRADVTFSLAGQTAKAVVEVTGVDADFHVDFVRDVMPVIAKAGCSAGTCHGSNKGKGGMKLSLRGNDPVFDVRVFTDDLAARRVNFASPDDSLMLLKASAGAPHEGGQVAPPGAPYYEILRKWIADGAKIDPTAPKVATLEIFPKDPIVQRVGGKQQFRVLATYRDGQVRDVTAESFVESSTIDVATADATGLVTALHRGETSVLARYEGAYAATILTVMGDRTGFVWKDPEANNFIDELVAAKLERTKTSVSPLCTDAEFLRRAHLDLTGLPPTADDVSAFLADSRDTRVKRDALIDRLIGGDDYVEHWTNKWADLLQVNRKYLGVEGAKAFRDWIRENVAANTPHDRFAYSLLSASGSNRENPPASYFKIHRIPEEAMENTTHLFLAVRFSCNKCHDHPFERWVQDNYWETAAYFARVGLKKDPASGDREIGKTAVEKGKPLYEIVFDKDEGEITHEGTGQITAPKFPYLVAYDVADSAPRREHMARWITSKDNRYFARSYVNRLWGYLLGVGFIEPIDDIRAGNPPTNPALLDRLTETFISSGFDVQHVVRTICKSRTYQRSIIADRWNEDDTLNYSHALARRLPAEVLYDALHRVTGSVSKLPGVAPGTRAAQLPDAGAKEPDGFLAKFGRPPRESACECERSSGMQFGPVMALVSGPTVGNAISDPESAIAKLIANEPDDAKLVNKLFLRILNRPATAAEIEACARMMDGIAADHQDLTSEFDQYDQSVAPKIAAQRQARYERIADTQADLVAYEIAIAPREAELDRQQQQATAKLEAALEAYEQALPARLAAWEARDDKVTEWTALDPVELSATSATTLTKQKDLSVVATSSNGLGRYTFVAHTDLVGITAVRLDVLADDRHPKKGPGRAPDGNFVLSEFVLTAAPKADPQKSTKIGLKDAQADFSQKGYDVATAIDGKVQPGANGWAIGSKPGVDHRACFQTQKTVGHEGGTILTFALDQQFRSGQHSIGRFRISVTTSPAPVLLDGLPDRIASILSVPSAERDAAQLAALTEFYRSVDGKLRAHQQAVAESKTLRPVDPTLQQWRDKLAAISRPLPLDPRLEQLRRDVELSTAQLEDQRRTGTEDLVWALINSPAFLFNR